MSVLEGVYLQSSMVQPIQVSISLVAIYKSDYNIRNNYYTLLLIFSLVVKPVFGLKGGSVAAIVLCVGLFLLCSGIGGGCTCSFICCKNQYNNNK